MERIKGLKEYITSEKFKRGNRISVDKEIELQLLAQGEYNINYTFVHPDTNKKLVLRINTGSQMHLENQMEYEYQALMNLKKVVVRQFLTTVTGV